ncbi:MAG: BREX-6 system phosphatase PglZ [Vulcanimicrobiota bacterium]
MARQLLTHPQTRKSRLAAHLEDLLAAKVRTSRLVVWLDREGVYSDFVDQLALRGFFAPIVSFRGSYLEMLLALDGKADGLDKPPLLVHLPGQTPETILKTPLLELYEAGTKFTKNLHTLIKEAAAGTVAPERIRDEVDKLPNFQAAEEWLTLQAEGGPSNEFERAALSPESLLNDLLRQPDSILDRKLEPADREPLLDYWSLKTGLLPDIRQALVQIRPASLVVPVVGWLLLMEYVNDLKRSPVGELRAVKEQAAFRKVCELCLSLVRASFPQVYKDVAQELENLPLLREDLEAGAAEELGKIDTFSREDLRLLEASLACLDRGDWKPASEWAEQRLESPSLWLQLEPDRKHRWELVGACSNLAGLCQRSQRPLKDCSTLEDVVETYASSLHPVDRAHRLMEQLYDKLRFRPEYASFKGAVDKVRQGYYSWLDQLNRDYNRLCEQLGFLPPAHLQQRQIYEQVVHPLVQQQKKTAFFLIDALRYEMAAELAECLQGGQLTARLKPRMAELPTITKVGMNALAPVARDGQLRLKKAFEGFVYEDFSVNSPARRIQAMGQRSLDPVKHKQKMPLAYTLKELIAAPTQQVSDAVAQHRMVVVSSGEVDQAGERDLGASTFEGILSKLQSAVRILHNCGVKHFVLTADHGFLINNPKAPPIPYDNGEVTRRYALTATGASVATDEMVTVSLKQLSYDGPDQVLCFARDSRSFSAQGQYAETYSHGGNSLQERVIPVLTLDYGDRAKASPRTRFCIKASLIETTPTMSRLRVQVEEVHEGQMALIEAGQREVRLAFSSPDPKAGVQLLGATGAQVVNQQLVVIPGQNVDNVVLLTSGSPGVIQISHPDSDYQIATVEVALAAVTVRADWQALVEDANVLKILSHLDKHGSIREEEIFQLVDNNRAARRFANALEPLRAKLPFKVRIDASNGTTYIKE